MSRPSPLDDAHSCQSRTSACAPYAVGQDTCDLDRLGRTGMHDGAKELSLLLQCAC